MHLIDFEGGVAVSQFDGRVALITGGGGGIGRATALVFAENGSRVAVADRRETEGMETVRLIESTGGEAVFVPTDVTDESQVEAMVARTVEVFGRLDHAFNNAGILGDQVAIDAYPRATWDSVIAVNLTGVWLCMQYEIRHMLTTDGGSIVNTASIAGLRGSPGVPAYSVSKWGVVGMTKAAAKSYGGDGIRVNAVCPGYVDTPMVSEATEDEEHMSRILDQYPLSRIGQPLEIAEAVVWLSSDAASFITGIAFPVDGGATA